jgi:hypothetical protein
MSAADVIVKIVLSMEAVLYWSILGTRTVWHWAKHAVLLMNCFQMSVKVNLGTETFRVTALKWAFVRPVMLAFRVPPKWLVRSRFYHWKQELTSGRIGD